MLTVKFMAPGGAEQILTGPSVGFNPEQKSVAVAGHDMIMFLKKGDVAYVMNQNGKTVAHYSG